MLITEYYRRPDIAPIRLNRNLGQPVTGAPETVDPALAAHNFLASSGDFPGIYDAVFAGLGERPGFAVQNTIPLV